MGAAGRTAAAEEPSASPPRVSPGSRAASSRKASSAKPDRPRSTAYSVAPEPRERRDARALTQESSSPAPSRPALRSLA